MPGYYGSAVYGSSAYGPTATDDAVATLAQLKAHLGGLQHASDEQLAAVLDTALDIAERYAGRIWAARLVQETYDGDRAALALSSTPVQSIETVVESGATLAASGWTLDQNAGVLYRGTSTSAGEWACGRQNVVVTYVAGPSVVPPTVRHAVLELARHLWDTQRGGSKLPRQTGAGDEWDPRSGFSIPRRVAELLDSHRAPGFA